MNTPETKTSIARQVELIIRQLNTLSTLPQVASEILPCILQEPFQQSRLAEIIEADPAMTASVFALAGRLGIAKTDETPFAEIINTLPAFALRDAVLSVRVVQADNTLSEADKNRPLPQKQLSLHALATACCAELIGEIVLNASERRLAFAAGLLHDIGKAGLNEAMPKSFDQLVIEAQQKQVSFAAIEQKHLGLTHSLLGKRLAEKWSLPEPITQSIWLHHTDAHVLSEMPFGQLAMVVALADGLARKHEIGQSGSYDYPEQIETLVSLLGLNETQMSHISRELPLHVERRCKLLGLADTKTATGYTEIIHQAAAQFARDNSKLSQQREHSFDTTVFAEPIRSFLATLATGSTPDQTAERLAVCLQQSLTANAVIVLLWPNASQNSVEIAIASRKGNVETTVLPMPETGMQKDPFAGKFAIIPASEHFGWCVEQTHYLTTAQTLVAPLLLSGKLVGVILFETEKEFAADTLQFLCTIGASAITAAGAYRQQREQAEQMLVLMDKLRQTGKELAEAQSLSAIAEMAAGAAHELNNPLAVIAGRAQLLIQSETEPNKKQVLEQIEQRAKDISDMVTDLMAFARPREPYRQLFSPLLLVSEAIKKTCAVLPSKQIDTHLIDIDKLADVFVDKSQILIALVHILSNAMESYSTGSGAVTLTGQNLTQENGVEIRITDQGCGMNETTLRQAIRPFFSAKPAGRKRGMGLAHAQRLLALNGASLHLISQPNKGATAIIRLPRV
jgi:signal transduction histidine kinase/HD-like signal output (HDOD) protein